MEIFLVVLSYFLIVGISVFLLIKLNLWIKQIRLQKTKIDNLEHETYIKLRDLQYKSKDTTKLVKKLVKQRNSVLSDITSNLIIMLLPFKKLKTILLLRKFFKNVKSGFTFAELMISLVVISMLAAVLYPNLMHFLPNSNKPLFKAAYKTISNALAEITTEKSTGKLVTTTVGGVSSGQQLCVDFCKKANIVPETAAGGNVVTACDTTNICNDSKLTTTNGMRWLFEDYASAGYPVLEYRSTPVNKSAFRVTVDVNPSNSDLASSLSDHRCTFVGNFSADGANNNDKGIFCYGNDADENGVYAVGGHPSAANVNGTFNLDNAKAQDTFQFLIDERGKIISISPVGWAILEDNIQLD